jgi:hypothetical protein
MVVVTFEVKVTNEDKPDELKKNLNHTVEAAIRESLRHKLSDNQALAVKYIANERVFSLTEESKS